MIPESESPSPKFQAKKLIDPSGSLLDEASNSIIVPVGTVVPESVKEAKGGRLTTVKEISFEEPMFPEVSFAKTVIRCDPFPRLVRVVFPTIVTFSAPFRL